MKQILLAATSGLTLIAVAAPGAWAQSTSDARPSIQLEEVTVVARRTEESSQSVPITVTAISSERLENLSIRQATDLQKLVPTLNVGTSSTSPGQTYSLRGVRTGVVTYFNEVPIPTDTIDLQLWDLQSVQAVAGPQGTLFGRNSTGGAVLFVPQRPTDDFGGYVEGQFGSKDLREGTAVLNMPVGDMLKLRVGAQVTRRDGMVENLRGADYQSQHRNAYRLSAELTPTDWLSNYTVVDFTERDEIPTAGITRHLTVRACPPGPLSCIYDPAQVLALGALQEQLGSRKISTPYTGVQYTKSLGISDVLSADIGPLTARYILGYRDSEARQLRTGISLALPIVIGENATPRFRQVTHELQLVGKLFDERLNWLVGAFVSDTNSRNSANFTLLAPATTPDFDPALGQGSGSVGESKSRAVYSQGTLSLTDQLSLTVGLRYTQDKNDVSVTAFRQGFVCTLPNIPGVDLATCQRPLSLDQHATTYNVSLDYKLSPDALLYVTTRRGYNGGGFNSGIPDPALARYNPEYITDYETGIKTDWYLGSMPVRTNVAAFYAKYEDIIRTTTVIRNNFANTGSFNAAKATIYGAQLELQAKPSDKLTLDASYGYLHTKYDSFDNPLLGNLAGNQFAQAPEQTFNGSVTYTQPLPSGELVGIANYAYISEITFSDANVGFPYSFQKGYGLLDLRLELRDIAQLGLDVGIYAKNVTDELYALGITDQTANFGFSSYTYGEPRTYGVELRYRFD